MGKRITRKSLETVDVNVQGRGLRSKLLILTWFTLTLFVFAIFMDFIINGWGVQYTGELPSWLYTFINPLKWFFGLFGELTVTDAWLAYAFGMFAMWFLIFFGFFILTGQPRFLILGIALSLLAVPVEDYMANIIAGNVIPVWEGPIKGLGFIGPIPIFYIPFLLLGSLLLITWLFWEQRLIRLYKGIDSAQKTPGKIVKIPRKTKKKFIR